jgi:hypothetical protein
MRPHLRERLGALDPQWPRRLGENGAPRCACRHLRHRADPRYGYRNGCKWLADHVRARSQSDLSFLCGAIASRRATKHLVAGMCETDCRDDTIKAVQQGLNQGMDRRFVITYPLILMWIDKAATFALGHRRGGTR